MEKIKKAVFIINPVAGGGNKGPVVQQIKKYLRNDISYEIINWDFPHQKTEIIKRIKENDFDLAVAVGGDGTINQVAQAVANTNKKLAIIPVGSGNGLARHLQIPLDVKAAIDVINNGKSICVDSCNVNDLFFVCTSGIGFDAHIGKLFAESKTRGFYTYFKLTMSQFMSYKPEDYKLFIDDKEISAKAFLITFANASQYGNNAYIAPQADIQDGLIDVCILKPFNAWNVVSLGWRMFNKTIHRSPLMETYRAKTLLVKRTTSGPVHYDGEPNEMGELLRYEILPSSLNVLVP